MELKFAPFSFGCACGRRIIVNTHERDLTTICPDCGESFGVFGGAPDLSSLPGPDASLAEMIGFSNAYNPLPHLRREHGNAAADALIDEIRGRFVSAFRNGEPTPGTVDEILIAMAYDSAIFPMLGISEENASRLMRWFIEGIRDSADR